MAKRRMAGLALTAIVAVACSTSAPTTERADATRDGSGRSPRDGSTSRDDGANCSGKTCVDGGVTDASVARPCGIEDATPCVVGTLCTASAMCASHVCAPVLHHAPPPVPDAGQDASSDATTDTSTDSGLDAPPALIDSGATAPSDGGAIDCRSGKSCTCQSPTSADGVTNDSETDVDCGGGFLADGTVNASSDGAPPCGQGKSCVLGSDCTQGVCNTNGEVGGPPINCPAGAAGCTCQAPSNDDGVKNDGETDVDCGGDTLPGSDDAPPCAPGQQCAASSDCTSLNCQGAMPATGAQPMVLGVCMPATCTDGIQDGAETDVDCGGSNCPGCGVGLSCVVRTDCASLGCDYTSHCALAPSCVAHFGGDTCGADEDIGPNPALNPVQESCCESIAVPGFTDPSFPGKTVYLDKYEITAGRMRAFIDYVSSLSGGDPNVLAYTSQNRPAVNWNPAWETILPSNMGSAGQVDDETFTTGQPELVYPSSSPAAPCYPPWSIVPGTYTIQTGLEYLLGPLAYFPECSGGGSGPATVSQPTGNYCEYHNFNCTNEDGAEGFGTYWFDLATEQDADPASLGKHWTQAELDEKALNCTPLGLFAAFCAWDGGQLMTEEVFQAVTAGVNIPFENDTAWANCQGGTITTYDTAAYNCDSVYYYPYDDSAQSYDNSSVVAAPGRVPGDVVTMAGGAGPWHDLIGNLIEGVLLPTGAFGFQGAGFGFGDSVDCHTYEYSTPRMKNAATGARCMRFK